MRSWTTPTTNQVQSALAKLVHPGARRYFFERLENPEWLKPLDDLGCFKSSPKPVRDDAAGTIGFPDWPEAKYLFRVAPDKPDHVAVIADRMLQTENIRVRDDLIEIARRLPPSLAVKIAHCAKEWAWPRYHLMLPTKLARLVVHLTQGKEDDAAFGLAESILAIRKSPKKGSSTPEENGDVEVIVSGPTTNDHWHYSESLKIFLPALLEVDSVRTLELFSTLLLNTINGKRSATGRDYSSTWRETIENSGDRTLSDVENSLVDAVRDTAVHIGKTGQLSLEVLNNKLEAYSWSIFKRIALHLLVEFSPQSRDIAADTLLHYEWYKPSDLHHEYGRLLSKRFVELTPQEQELVVSAIVKGPDLSELHANYKRAHGQDPTTETIERHSKSWVLDWLLAFGINLPSRMEKLKAELISEVGLPEPMPRGAVWMGPTSPKSADELRSMTVSEVIELLRTWQPTRSIRSPSPEGLARTLQPIVKERANEFATEAERFQETPPTYVRALLTAFVEASAEGVAFPWAPALRLCAWVASQPSGTESDDSFLFEDCSWLGTRSTIGRLLNSSFRSEKNPLPIEERESAWHILVSLLEDPDPTPDRESQNSKIMEDATMLAISSVRGVALEATIQYALWLRRSFDLTAPEVAAKGFDAMPEFKAVLDRHLDTTLDPSLAIRSIYSRHFPWLVLLDKNWASTAVEHIFPEDADQKLWWTAAWNGYILSCDPYDSIFELLRTKYARAIKQLNEENTTRREESIDEHLGSHLATLYWRGKISLEESDLLWQFFLLAPPRARANVIDFIGRSLKNTSNEEIPLAVLIRLKTLWEKRIDMAHRSDDIELYRVEIESFSSWFSSDKFDKEWAFSQLENVLQLLGRIRVAFSTMQHLAALAPRFPLRVINCIQIFLNEQVSAWEILSENDELRKILESALHSPDVDARKAAEDIIHSLAEKGTLEYRTLLSPNASKVNPRINQPT